MSSMNAMSYGAQSRPASVMGPARRTFYSKTSGLTININPGSFQDQAGRGGVIVKVRVGEKIASFQPFNTTQNGGMVGGYLNTSDPEIIEFMERRMVEVGDVYDETGWKTVVFADNAPGEANRLITDQNRMILDLQRQNELLAQQNAQLQAQVSNPTAVGPSDDDDDDDNDPSPLAPAPAPARRAGKGGTGPVTSATARR